MKYYAIVGDREYECTLDSQNGELFVEIDGKRYRTDLRHIPRSHAYSLLLDGRSYEFAIHEDAGAIELDGAAGQFHVEVEDARTHAARVKTGGSRSVEGPLTVKAVMPGIVREVRVAPGEPVAKGHAMIILEAMKMQNEIRADRSGTVKRVHVAVGDTVEKGAKLVEIE